MNFVKQVAGIFTGASFEAVREWYQKGREFFELSTVKKKRKQVAVDEKELTINGTTIFIDGGSWYPWDLNVVRFKRYTVVSFGPRSAIERLFGNIECRIR